MRRKKQFWALLLVFLVIFNSSFGAYAAIANKLTINGNILDKIVKEVEYGSTGVTYQFDGTTLDGIVSGNDVYLVADSEYDSTDVGERNITLTNFRLEGNDAEFYEMQTIEEPLESKISITPKVINIAPRKTYMYYGQKKPEMISEIADYSSQIVSGDTVNLKAKFKIGDDGSIVIIEDSIECDNDNYGAEYTDVVKFEVKEYDPSEAAITETDNYVGVKEAILKAPEGFLISKENKEDSEWSSSITIALEETQNGVASYYLRCNDSSNTEYYQAISKEKQYHYTSDQTVPEIVDIKIEKIDENAVLNFLTFGVFGNGSVNITVEAVGTSVEQETMIYLGEEGRYESKLATPKERDGKYYYSAVFTYDVIKYSNLNAYAVNSSGSGGKYATLSGINDLNNNYITVESKPFLLERVLPEITESKFKSNSEGVVCNVTVSDGDSGIAKIEYGWDLDRSFCNDEKNAEEEHYCGFQQNGYIEQYIPYDFNNAEQANLLNLSLELKFSDAVWAKDNRHTLYMRITDNAGNEEVISLRDPVGSDMNPPNITSVEIRKHTPDTLESILRFLTFGIFSNSSVEVVIMADDISVDNTCESGISTVEIEYGTNQKKDMVINDAGEYVLTVSAESVMEAMRIIVKDNVGWTTTAIITDIPSDTNVIQSDKLIVETNKPIVTWDFSSKGQNDDVGNVWYGSKDAEEFLSIKVSDEVGNVQSGLYSIKITDNDKIIYEKTDFLSLGLEVIQTYKIGDFEDGVHTITVTAEDNAGNLLENIEQRTFCIDSQPPEKGTISIVNPSGKEIDEKQWFSKEDIIEFQVNAADVGAGVKSILVDINGQDFIFGKNEIISDGGEYYVNIDTTNVSADSEQRYNVRGVVTDYAGNELELDNVTVYMDFENPIINKFTVEKTTFGRILNVLPFGVYANDTLILKAYVSDGKFDSGVDYVSIDYDGLSTPRIMVSEGNGVFSAEIPAGSKVFQSDVTVVAYDKYGKSSICCPNLEDAENQEKSDKNYVMIEQLLPNVILSMPVGDGEERTDGQRWYNSNKEISLSIQDKDSGIRNVNLTVNGIDVLTDKNGVTLLKTAATESASTRNIEEQEYVFDTDYFTDIVGESTDGKYFISVEVTDNAGNISSIASDKTIYYIDKEAPQICKVEFSPMTANGIRETEEFIEETVYGFFFKTDFVTTVHVSDELPSSGLQEIKYRLVSYENGLKKTEHIDVQEIANGKADLMIPQGFKGQIYVEAFDNVNNSSGEKSTRAYVVDSMAPNITIFKNESTPYRDAAGNELYIGDNSITVEIEDNISGIREVGYSQNAEQNPYDRKAIVIGGSGYKVGDALEDGWSVSAIDQNLVTKITKTFYFNVDDNDVILMFDATDNALNKKESVKSEAFTIDKIAPIVNISFRDDEDSDVYYNQNRIAEITVIERNFDENLIKVMIKNSYGAVPAFSFSEKSKTEHVAVVEFDEGDYLFNVTGTDLGYHAAIVNYSGGNENRFSVDKTAPLIDENFETFINSSTENSFNSDKTINIKITEHNFNPELVKLKIIKKEAGMEHNNVGFVDVTSEVLGNTKWKSEGDMHTISFIFGHDAVYQVAIAPADLADNDGESRSTVVFEIDKTVPIVTAKNGVSVSAENTEYLDIYSYLRAEEPAPTVEFDDLNIDHINYNLTVYIPDYTSSEATTIIKPVRVYLDEDQNKTGTIKGNKFILPNFVKDGVYALELVAVDTAGNESLLNINTYVRLIEQDVLAYIMESNLEQETGLYSFQYENGDAISKRPDNFKDIKVFVVARSDTDVDIVLRDSNGNEFDTNALSTTDDSIYGMTIYNFTLKSDFFKENFQNDTDTELHLTVKNGENRIDLGKMHIDNIAPTCVIPEEFKSWKWYYGEGNRTIILSNISELIDMEQSKVYDNGEEIVYTYSSENNTIEFTLEKGWHNVGITLKDMAGNTYNIQEKTNIHIGYFWLQVMVGLFIISFVGVACVIVHNKRKKQREESEI